MAHDEPMIRHIALIAFEGADDSLLDTVISELRALPDLIPEIADYTVGSDLGLRDGPPTVVVIADFASVDDYHTYSSHPEHVRVSETYVKPHSSALSRAQIDLG